MSEKAIEIYACQYCGCEDVQTTAWVDVNSCKVLDIDPPFQDPWCPACETETSFASYMSDDPERKNLYCSGMAGDPETVPVFKGYDNVEHVESN